ncbi:MAG: DUF1015 domain-containing protein [Ruminococcaceae bacterium]|nr:DUF1015 domain-containing protein [Oscillospiraceae bacterium]
MSIFTSSQILLPQVDSMEKWAVIACDQFSAEPEYWQAAHAFVGDAPSALRLIWPEAELDQDPNVRIPAINKAMADYLAQGLFKVYDNSFILVERTLQSGLCRLGVVGAVDLSEYDYTPGSASSVRATEKTVLERIPPRVNIRKNAPLELPHVLLLCDDPEKTLVEALYAKRDSLPLVYDFSLMAQGGRIRGWLVAGADAQAFQAALDAYESTRPTPIRYAVGDGNHSLASAKACYDQSGEPLARYALVELENIHDPALEFEPIHRVILHTDPEKILEALAPLCDPAGTPVDWYSGERTGTVYLKLNPGQLAVGALQSFLDEYLQDHPGITDYIHGLDSLKNLSAQPDAIGFCLPAMDKGSLFPGIAADGVLPRKTFSMGHAREKRYYLEARKIR